MVDTVCTSSRSEPTLVCVTEEAEEGSGAVWCSVEGATGSVLHAASGAAQIPPKENRYINKIKIDWIEDRPSSVPGAARSRCKCHPTHAHITRHAASAIQHNQEQVQSSRIRLMFGLKPVRHV